MRGQPTRTRQCRRCKRRRALRHYTITDAAAHTRSTICEDCEVADASRICTQCHKDQPIENFDRTLTPGNRSVVCKSCVNPKHKRAQTSLLSEKQIIVARERADEAWVREGWDALRRNREEAQR